MGTPGDQGERDRAIRSDRNLVVVAGAGTGKTTLLVSKIVRKVVEEGVDVTRILALTFTEKAASEMRGRVREELERAGKAGGLERAEIGTIHSFCAHILREFPVEAGVAPDFKVDEGAAFRRLFERQWPLWLDRELGRGARRPRQWQDVLERVKLDTLGELARGLSSFSVPEGSGDGAATLKSFTTVLTAEVAALAPAFSGAGPAPRPPAKSSPATRSAYKLAADMAAIDDKLVRRAVSLVSGFAREFRRAYLARGYVSFEAMLTLVHELFRNAEFPNVLELLREKYRYVLVDEFQDTDPLQGEIIQRLAEDAKGRLVPGKLFVVGDPKQSIYSFRGADIVAYHRVVDRVLEEGGESVVLRTNFRSHGALLDLVNDVFSKVIVENGRLQPRYEAIEPRPDCRPALPAPFIEAVLIEDADASQSREAEGRAIAEWIKAHPGIPLKEVAILFKALTDVPIYLESLRAAGIPYAVEGEKYFYGTGEVIDFVNLLRAVHNPHDRLALAGLLRSPYGAASDQELYDLRKKLDYRLESDLPLFRLLRRWNGRAGAVGVPELIDTIFEESYALEIAHASYHGEQAVANLLKLRAKAAELEGHGGCTLREFLDVMRRAVRELEEEGESPLSDETLDAVRILSIHRAKGLEFPVVILPDLHRRGASADDRAVRYDWPTRTMGVRLGDACDSGGAALSFLDRERRREEEKRLLYVAVTRAREKLVLLGSAGAEAATYLSLLLPELEKRKAVSRRAYRPLVPAAAPAPPERERPDWDAFVRRWRERERRAAPVGRFTTPTRLEEDADETAAPSRAAEVGTACHEVLEAIDFRAPEVPDGTDAEAKEILQAFFGSEAFREIANAEVVARELPFVYRRGEQILQGTVDLVYRRGGNLFVGEYKTDKIIVPGDYALVREFYTEAVARAFGEKPQFRLIYLRHGKIV